MLILGLSACPRSGRRVGKAWFVMKVRKLRLQSAGINFKEKSHPAKEHTVNLPAQVTLVLP